jgi:hypothetical protein
MKHLLEHSFGTTAFSFVALVAVALLVALLFASCGSGTAIVFGPDGIAIVPPADQFIIPGTEPGVDPGK